LSVLEQGIKYNFNQKPKNWIQTIALEAETAINFLTTSEQDHIRWQVAKTINKLYKLNPKSTGYCNHNEKKIVKSIKGKLYDNKAIITWADKGNTTYYIPQRLQPKNQ
jgi:hypothetical protein